MIGMARPSMIGPPEGRSAFFALIRVLAALLGTLSVLGALLYSFYMSYTEITPGEVEVAVDELSVDESGRKVEYGRSWLDRKGRIWHLHLEGSPEEIGDAHGRLSARLFRRVDARIGTLVAQRFGAWLEPWAASTLLRWDYRGADETALRSQDRRELAAFAQALPAGENEGLAIFHRLFLYQCFLDLSQRLDDVIVDGAMFAVAPKPRANAIDVGNLIIGRTLTIDLGHDFEADRVVSFYHPDGKYPFVSVGWAGLIGVVTGINARGIFVAVNPARTDEPREEGVALPIVLRQILEESDTIDQAVAILESTDVRSAGVVLIGDGVKRKAVVMELAPRAREENRSSRGEDENAIWATDHFVREVFQGDAQNDRITRTTSSGYRYERLGELLTDTTNFTHQSAVSVLRDRRGKNNEELGLGNRNALENLITTHSVVIDATAMVMWVAEGPSTLGRYRAFDLRHLLTRHGKRPAPLDDVEPDPLLYSEEYKDYQEALQEIEHARYLLGRNLHEDALSSARIALALAPDVGDLHRLLGDIERDLGHQDEAIRHYQRYIELVPGRHRDQEIVRGIIEQLGG
jgi:tetratricopeptide (TPR) repeat protein